MIDVTETTRQTSYKSLKDTVQKVKNFFRSTGANLNYRPLWIVLFRRRNKDGFPKHLPWIHRNVTEKESPVFQMSSVISCLEVDSSLLMSCLQVGSSWMISCLEVDSSRLMLVRVGEGYKILGCPAQSS